MRKTQVGVTPETFGVSKVKSLGRGSRFGFGVAGGFSMWLLLNVQEKKTGRHVPTTGFLHCGQFWTSRAHE